MLSLLILVLLFCVNVVVAEKITIAFSISVAIAIALAYTAKDTAIFLLLLRIENAIFLLLLDPLLFQDEDKDIYANIHDLRNAMEQLSTQIGKERWHVAVPDDSGLNDGKMRMLDAEFREKQNQLQMLIDQRKAK